MQLQPLQRDSSTYIWSFIDSPKNLRILPGGHLLPPFLPDAQGAFIFFAVCQSRFCISMHVCNSCRKFSLIYWLAVSLGSGSESKAWIDVSRVCGRRVSRGRDDTAADSRKVYTKEETEAETTLPIISLQLLAAFFLHVVILIHDFVTTCFIFFCSFFGSNIFLHFLTFFSVLKHFLFLHDHPSRNPLRPVLGRWLAGLVCLSTLSYSISVLFAPRGACLAFSWAIGLICTGFLSTSNSKLLHLRFFETLHYIPPTTKLSPDSFGRPRTLDNFRGDNSGPTGPHGNLPLTPWRILIRLPFKVGDPPGGGGERVGPAEGRK